MTISPKIVYLIAPLRVQDQRVHHHINGLVEHEARYVYRNRGPPTS